MYNYALHSFKSQPFWGVVLRDSGSRHLAGVLGSRVPGLAEFLVNGLPSKKSLRVP